MKTETAKGWGIRVGGKNSQPYLAFEMYPDKKRAIEHLEQPYHRAVKVVLVPLAEYRRLKQKGDEDDIN